jgi:hypothetical protein
MMIRNVTYRYIVANSRDPLYTPLYRLRRVQAPLYSREAGAVAPICQTLLYRPLLYGSQPRVQ